MVTEALLEVDALAARKGRDLRRGEVIVEPPADVFCSRLATVAPPGVLLGMRVERAKDVDEAELLEQPCHPGALLGEEAAVLAVALPVLEVDLLVRNVDVADEDDLALLAEAFEIRRHQGEEGEFRLLPMLARRAAREIAADDAQPRQRFAAAASEARLDVAALGVEFPVPEAEPHRGRLPAAVEADPRVALLLGEVEMPLHSGDRVEASLDRLGLGLDLLHAHTIGADALRPGPEAFRR